MMVSWIMAGARARARDPEPLPEGTFKYGAATLSGQGAVSAIGRRIVTGLCSLSGQGSIEVTGTVDEGGTFKYGAATLSGQGTVSAIGRRIVTASCTLSGTGNLTAIGILDGEETLRLNMKSYGNHDTAYDARIKAIRPEYVIDNPIHGPYGELYGYEDWLLSRATIADWQSVGIKVVGYLSGGYEGDGTAGGEPLWWVQLAFNLMCIEQMAEDGCDGIFIDECSEQPQQLQRRMDYLTALTDKAHSLGMMTWGNTGVDQFSSWFFTDGGFDLMQSSEAWQGQSLSQIQLDWGHRISVTGFNSSYTAQDAYDLTIDAWEKEIAYCYINDAEYETVAVWFEEYTDMLRAY